MTALPAEHDERRSSSLAGWEQLRSGDTLFNVLPYFLLADGGYTTLAKGDVSSTCGVWS